VVQLDLFKHCLRWSPALLLEVAAAIAAFVPIVAPVIVIPPVAPVPPIPIPTIPAIPAGVLGAEGTLGNGGGHLTNGGKPVVTWEGAAPGSGTIPTGGGNVIPAGGDNKVPVAGPGGFSFTYSIGIPPLPGPAIVQSHGDATTTDGL